MGIRISEMEEAASFGEEDLIPIVSNGTNKKALGSKIKDFIKGGFTASRAVITDANGNISTSNVTSTELSYLSGMDKNIIYFFTNKTHDTSVEVDSMHGGEFNGIYWVRKTNWADMPSGSYGNLEVMGTMQRFTPYGTQGRTELFVRMYTNSTWTPWKEIISTETLTSSTGTNGASILKFGNVVTVNFQGVTGSEVGSVSSSYRPSEAAVRSVVLIEKYNGSTLQARYYGLIAIESNGNIACSYPSSYGGTSFVSAKDANHKIYGTITYIV